LLPFERGAALDNMGSKRPFAAFCANDGNADEAAI
jgi:hypothetical protein